MCGEGCVSLTLAVISFNELTVGISRIFGITFINAFLFVNISNKLWLAAPRGFIRFPAGIANFSEILYYTTEILLRLL